MYALTFHILKTGPCVDNWPNGCSCISPYYSQDSKRGIILTCNLSILFQENLSALNNMNRPPCIHIRVARLFENSAQLPSHSNNTIPFTVFSVGAILEGLTQPALWSGEWVASALGKSDSAPSHVLSTGPEFLSHLIRLCDFFLYTGNSNRETSALSY